MALSATGGAVTIPAQPKGHALPTQHILLASGPGPGPNAQAIGHGHAQVHAPMSLHMNPMPAHLGTLAVAGHAPDTIPNQLNAHPMQISASVGISQPQGAILQPPRVLNMPSTQSSSGTALQGGLGVGTGGIMPQLNNYGNTLCEHGERSYVCKKCLRKEFQHGIKACPHGKREYTCKDCKGVGICVHGKYKRRCIECGGSSICEHKRMKYQCRECGGKAFCRHNKQKSRCRECEGSDFCIHKKRKSRCKNCGGTELCVHGRRKYRCKDCGGSELCEHNRQKYACKECRAKTTLVKMTNMDGSDGSVHSMGDDMEKKGEQSTGPVIGEVSSCC